MINTNIKNIAIFTVGLSIGVGASAIFFKKKYEDFANEEIESVKETSKNKYKQWLNDKYGKPVAEGWKLSEEEVDVLSRGEKSGKDVFKEDVELNRNKTSAEFDGDLVSVKKEPFTKSIEEINRENQENALSRRTKKKDIIDYTKMAGKYKNEAEKIHEVNGTFDEDNKRAEAEYDYNNPSEEEERMNQSPNQYVPVPEIITVQSFVDEYPDHEKTTLNYYSVDEVLVDENDSPIEDVEVVIGDEALNSFGIFGAEENLVYVRNIAFGIDYEVVKLEERYSVH
jgi:hypothetical protein